MKEIYFIFSCRRCGATFVAEDGHPDEIRVERAVVYERMGREDGVTEFLFRHPSTRLCLVVAVSGKMPATAFEPAPGERTVFQ